MLGRQGAGKGTQCVRLSRHYVVPHISTGDMLRAAVKAGTEFGHKAKEFMDAGELVPDEIMVGVVDDRLDQTTPRTGGSSSTASPARRPGRGAGRDRRPTGRSTSSSTSRCHARSCSSASPAGGSASTAARTTRCRSRPKYAWICDVCGGDVVQRDDDTQEAIQRRLDLYEQRDRAAHRLVPRAQGCSRTSTAWARADEVHGPADRGRSTSAAARSERLRRGSIAAPAPPTSSTRMRRAGRVVAEMHEAHPCGHPARA